MNICTYKYFEVNGISCRKNEYLSKLIFLKHFKNTNHFHEYHNLFFMGHNSKLK